MACQCEVYSKVDGTAKSQRLSRRVWWAIFRLCLPYETTIRLPHQISGYSLGPNANNSLIVPGLVSSESICFRNCLLGNWHPILQRLWTPRQLLTISRHSGSPANLLESSFEEVSGQRDFYDQIVRDLHYRGLMSIDSLHTRMTVRGMFDSRTTEMAKGFLAFILSSIPEWV